MTEIGDPEPDRADTRFNDGKCDPQGRFWCGTFHDYPDPKQRQPVAALYRLEPDLRYHKVVDGVRGSNGIGWSPDGRTMYYTDTPTFRIDAFDFDPETGSVANRRVFARVSEGSVVLMGSQWMRKDSSGAHISTVGASPGTLPPARSMAPCICRFNT